MMSTTTTKLIALLIVLATVGPPALALDITVTLTSDTNDGFPPYSLRDAIILANVSPGEDTIYLGAYSYGLTIPGLNEDAAHTGDRDITESVTIVGRGPGATIVDAGFLDRVFHVVSPSAEVSFHGMTITGGGHILFSGDGGAGVWNQGGMVYLFSCEVRANIASRTSGSDYWGGGLLNSDGAMWVINSSIANNRAKSGGGGIASRGLDATLVVLRSPVSGNPNVNGPGAVYAQGGSYFVNSTIANNGTSGVYNRGAASFQSCTVAENGEYAISSVLLSSQVNLENTIIWGSCHGEPSNFVTDYGNLEHPGDTCNLGILDIPGAAVVGLEPMAKNGGPTMTYRPEPGSLLIDHWFAGDNCLSEDQRRAGRPVDGDGDGYPECDIGAVEWVPGEVFIEGFDGGFFTGWAAVTD